jgi:hypothetical protein
LNLVSCASSPKTEVKPAKLEKIEISTKALEWVRSAEPVSRRLRLSAQYPQTGYYECRETVEVQDTFLCHFNNKEDMGYALARASCYIEGSFCGHERGTIIGFNDPGFRSALLQINGFDLKGTDLLRFYEATQKKCDESKSEEFCFNHFEKSFFEKTIIPWSKSTPKFVLITFARFSGEPWHVSLVHEIMHAQYFQDEKYRQVVESFWKNHLSEKDRSEIRKTLSVAYDPKDEFLMMNEFQAYILQSGAEAPSSLLHRFVPAHRGKLMKQLKDAGVNPVQVQIPIPK